MVWQCIHVSYSKVLVLHFDPQEFLKAYSVELSLPVLRQPGTTDRMMD